MDAGIAIKWNRIMIDSMVDRCIRQSTNGYWYIFSRLKLDSYIKQCITDNVRHYWNRHNATGMQLTLTEFEYLALCLHGFLFGEISVLQLSDPFLNSFKITSSQDSIRAYLRCICKYMHPEKRPIAGTWNKIFFFMLSGSYMCYLQLPLLLILRFL